MKISFEDAQINTLVKNYKYFFTVGIESYYRLICYKLFVL